MKAVGVVLKQLMTARNRFDERGRDEAFDGKLEKLRLNLNKIKDVFERVKKNEEELLDRLAEVYDHLRKLERRKLDEEMDGICKRIRDSAQKLVPMDGFDESYEEENHKAAQIFQPSQDLQQPHPESWTMEYLDRLEGITIECLMSLLMFPENAVISKRNVINLWIGEGWVQDRRLGEDMIKELLKLKVIVCYGNRKSPIVNKFQILPGILRWLLESYVSKEIIEHPGQYLKLCSEGGFVENRLGLKKKTITLGDWYFGDRTIHTVFNISASYLNFRPKWVTELKKNLLVLQLGRWQDSPFHHIEVGSQEFLKDLANLTQLRYLSLRGISRIFELPSSIVQLETLLILDLKACHNLETLPNDISSMRSLTHLILSQCYLLEGMPKGIDKLTELEVLKGFVISTPEKTPCRISNLVNLKKLRRLSIYIGREAVMRDWEFEGLEFVLALEHLKISWKGSDPSYGNICLPPNLRKLHLECFPRKSFEELFIPPKVHYLFPLRMQNVLRVRELNISGGKLESMDVDEKWRNVETLRLKYLKQLNVDVNNLKALFPRLRYVEIRQIANHSDIEHEY